MSMQPRRELEGKPVTRLMDVQDNTGRGDGETVRKVMTTFQMDADLKAELKRYCADNGMKNGRDHQPSHRTMASNQMNIRFYINKYSATFSVYLA